MPRKKKDPTSDESSVAMLASTKGVADQSKLDALLAEVESLRAQLGVKDEALTEANKRALAMAEAQASFQQSTMQEVPTGRTMKVQRLDDEEPYETKGYKDDGRPILKPRFVTKEVPTWFYKIDIPAMAGWDMKINGLPIVHGATYEFDLGTLQYVKDMIYRAWQHEAVTTGSQNENLFRKPQEKRIGSRA